MSIELISAIATGALTVITSILALITNKGKTLLDKNQQITQELPKYIKEAETIFGDNNGAIKLMYVLTKASQKALELRVQLNTEKVVEQIESILTTPQKKEVAENGGKGTNPTAGTGDTASGNEDGHNTEQPATNGASRPTTGDTISKTTVDEPSVRNQYTQIYGGTVNKTAQ